MPPAVFPSFWRTAVPVDVLELIFCSVSFLGVRSFVCTCRSANAAVMKAARLRRLLLLPGPPWPEQTTLLPNRSVGWLGEEFCESFVVTLPGNRKLTCELPFGDVGYCHNVPTFFVAVHGGGSQSLRLHALASAMSVVYSSEGDWNSYEELIFLLQLTTTPATSALRFEVVATIRCELPLRGFSTRGTLLNCKGMWFDGRIWVAANSAAGHVVYCVLPPDAAGRVAVHTVACESSPTPLQDSAFELTLDPLRGIVSMGGKDIFYC